MPATTAITRDVSSGSFTESPMLLKTSSCVGWAGEEVGARSQKPEARRRRGRRKERRKVDAPPPTGFWLLASGFFPTGFWLAASGFSPSGFWLLASGFSIFLTPPSSRDRSRSAAAAPAPP